MTHRAQTGFTIVEVLVAVAIFAIALTGIASLLGTTVRANGLAAQLTAATQLTQDKLEELRNTPYTAVASGADSTGLTETGESGGVYTRSWTVTAGTPTATTWSGPAFRPRSSAARGAGRVPRTVMYRVTVRY